MPIDPDIKAVLEQIMPLLPESFEDVDPIQFRVLSDSHTFEIMPKIELETVEDIEIPVNDDSVKGRLYAANKGSDSLIVYYHGGGFVMGNIDTHDSVCRTLAKYSGSKVISVDYRLAPEHKFPTAVEDTYYSFKWIRENAQRFGIDKSKIAISGDSAGGNLCVTTCLMLKDNNEELPKLEVLYYPLVAPDLASRSYNEFSEGFFLTGSIMNWFSRQYIRTEADILSPYLSPLLSGNLSNMPETILVTAEYDPLRDQGETFVSALRRRGIHATGIRAMGMIHGFLGFHELSSASHDVLTMTARLIGDRLNE